tara:strand:+ start:560 stop:877 length:318 start_codon:yes stop_codon:yes gene_type:complete
MFLVRRVCRTERVNAWKVADLLSKICNAYEENGRDKATIYIGGAGTPAAEITVCAEWTQETIDANRMPNVPSAVRENAPKLMELIQSYDIEFFEIATKDKIEERA